MNLTEWLIAVSEADDSASTDSMTTNKPRRGYKPKNRSKRSTHRVDTRTAHDVAAELRRLHKSRITK